MTMPPLEFYEFYGASLRAGLFTGFISCGAFLLSMKTFIVLQMKKEVYDREEYQSDNILMSSSDLYRPLVNLNNAMFWGIVLCFLNAIIQYSVGLIKSDWAAIVCMGTSGIAIISLISCLLITTSNIKSMIDISKKIFDKKKLNNKY